MNCRKARGSSIGQASILICLSTLTSRSSFLELSAGTLPQPGTQLSPVLTGESCVPGCGNVPAKSSKKLERDVNVDKHIRILACPIEEPRALRQFMPDHPRLAVLIAEDEFQFITRMRPISGASCCIGGDQTVPCKEPVVLRASGSACRAVTGDVTATKIGIANPCLSESYL